MTALRWPLLSTAKAASDTMEKAARATISSIMVKPCCLPTSRELLRNFISSTSYWRHHAGHGDRGRPEACSPLDRHGEPDLLKGTWPDGVKGVNRHCQDSSDGARKQAHTVGIDRRKSGTPLGVIPGRCRRAGKAHHCHGISSSGIRGCTAWPGRTRNEAVIEVTARRKLPCVPRGVIPDPLQHFGCQVGRHGQATA